MQCLVVCLSVLKCVILLRALTIPVHSSMCDAAWCRVLQCIAAWCSLLQCVVVCCSVFECVEVCHLAAALTILEHSGMCVAVCCSVLQCVAVYCSVLQRVIVCCSMSSFCVPLTIPVLSGMCVAVCHSMLQCVAAWCSVLQCVPVHPGMFMGLFSMFFFAFISSYLFRSLALSLIRMRHNSFVCDMTRSYRHNTFIETRLIHRHMTYPYGRDSWIWDMTHRYTNRDATRCVMSHVNE